MFSFSLQLTFPPLQSLSFCCSGLCSPEHFLGWAVWKELLFTMFSRSLSPFEVEFFFVQFKMERTKVMKRWLFNDNIVFCLLAVFHLCLSHFLLLFQLRRKRYSSGKYISSLFHWRQEFLSLCLKKHLAHHQAPIFVPLVFFKDFKKCMLTIWSHLPHSHCNRKALKPYLSGHTDSNGSSMHSSVIVLLQTYFGFRKLNACKIFLSTDMSYFYKSVAYLLTTFPTTKQKHGRQERLENWNPREFNCPWWWVLNL